MNFTIWVFPKIGGYPSKSSIFIGISVIHHPFWGPNPIFGNIDIYIYIYVCILIYAYTLIHNILDLHPTQQQWQMKVYVRIPLCKCSKAGSDRYWDRLAIWSHRIRFDFFLLNEKLKEPQEPEIHRVVIKSVCSKLGVHHKDLVTWENQPRP